jgi:glycosyltransferase involved in cell wall biosynthesis
MKVLMATREFPPYIVGGIAIHTFYLSRALEKLGVDVRVISFGDPERSSETVRFVKPKSSVISRSPQPIGRDLAVLYDMARFGKILNNTVAKGDFDIVHVQEPYVGGFVKARNKVTTIQVTSYGELSSMASSSAAFLEMKKMLFYVSLGFVMEYASIATSKIIITTAPNIWDEVVHRYRLGIGKTVVIMNGVESENQYLSASKQGAKEMLQMDPTRVFVFASGRHVARKRLDILIKAISILKEKNLLNKIDVRIGGDGRVRPYLESLVRKLGLESRVKFLGWLDRRAVELYYRASDIFVSCSDYESGPISILEAMIAETSVVSTRIPGFATLAENHVNILLFPPSDHVALANAIELLARDEGLRESLSKNGKTFALRHTWDRVAERTLRVYDSCLEA